VQQRIRLLSPNHYFIGTWDALYDAQKPFTI